MLIGIAGLLFLAALFYADRNMEPQDEARTYQTVRRYRRKPQRPVPVARRRD